MQLRVLFSYFFLIVLNLSCQTGRIDGFYIYQIDNFDYLVYASDRTFYEEQVKKYQSITPTLLNSPIDSLIASNIDSARLEASIKKKEPLSLTVAFNHKGIIENVIFILREKSAIKTQDLLKLEAALKSDVNIFDFEFTGQLNPDEKYITRIRVPLARLSKRE